MIGQVCVGIVIQCSAYGPVECLVHLSKGGYGQAAMFCAGLGHALPAAVTETHLRPSTLVGVGLALRQSDASKFRWAKVALQADA
jgi:hypothetical protein